MYSILFEKYLRRPVFCIMANLTHLRKLSLYSGSYLLIEQVLNLQNLLNIWLKNFLAVVQLFKVIDYQDFFKLNDAGINFSFI